MSRLLFGLVLISCVIYSHGLLNLFGKKGKPAGFKVRFGSLTPINMPTTVKAATKKGWIKTERASDALMPELNLYCPKDDVTVCVLFLDVGYVAGLQIAVPIDQFTNSVPSDLGNIGFKKWTPTHGYYAGEEHWYTSQFFISEKTLASSTVEERAALADTEEILYEGGVWVTDIDGQTLSFVNGTGDVTDTLWKKQACMPAMGTHYYYNMSKTTSCDNLYPWFTLVDGEQLIGTGFMIFGDRVKPKRRQVDWFESPKQLAVRAIVPRGPDCIYELARNPGVTTLHIYYIRTPASVGCYLF